MVYDFILQKGLLVLRTEYLGIDKFIHMVKSNIISRSWIYYYNLDLPTRFRHHLDP